MKLALAVGILSRSLPFVSATTLDPTIRQGQRQKVDYGSLDDSSIVGNKNRPIEGNYHQDVQYCDPSSDDPDIGVLSCGDGLFCNYSKHSSTGGKCESMKAKKTTTTTMLEMISTAARFRQRGILRNKREGVDKNTLLGSEECDPQATPDVGILSCRDSSQICLPHAASSMGGFCIPSTSSRQLYHLTENAGLCDPNSKDYMYFDCDCSGFDNATGTGNVPCTVLDNYCIGILYPGCEGTCFTQTRNYTFTDFVAPSYVSCDVITGPNEKKICLEEFFETDACTLSINDKACTSCALMPSGNYTTISFDCTNVGGGSGTSNYMLDVAPIIYSCYTPSNYTCNICDGNLTYPDTIASVYGYSHECYVFERGLNESLCSVAAPMLAASCCGVVDEPAPSPPDSGEPDSTPTEPVPSPGPGPEPSIPSAGRSNLTFPASGVLSIGLAVAWLFSVVVQ